MLDTVDFNHVQHISFTQSRLTDAVSVILSELLSYEHPPKPGGWMFFAETTLLILPSMLSLEGAAICRLAASHFDSSP